MSKPTIKEELLSDDDRPNYQQILKQQLRKSEQLILSNRNFPDEKNKLHVQRNSEQVRFREDAIFSLFTSDAPVYLNIYWCHMLKLYPEGKNKVKNLANKRIRAVMKDLIRKKIQIEQRPHLHPYHYQQDSSGSKLFNFKEQSEEIQKKLSDIKQSLEKRVEEKDPRAEIYSEERKKQIEVWIEKNNKQKEERRKRREELQKKGEEKNEKKEKYIKEKEEEKMKKLKEEFIKKQMNYKKRRESEKAMREQRNSQYIKVKKELNENPRLFQRLMKSYSQKKQYNEMESRHELKNSNKQKFVSLGELNLDEHGKNYEQMLIKKEEERKKRIGQFLSQQSKSRIRYHSSFELEIRRPDKSQLIKEKAKQKAHKMKDYQMIVKDKYQPKVDEEKRKQMEMLLEEMELNSRKNLKKKILDNGKILYEEIGQRDTREIGMEYLELTKEMAHKARAMRGRSDEKQSFVPPEKNKTVDYLEHFRKNPRPKPPKLSFMSRKDLSYDQKLERVIAESERLKANAKANEDKLKFGNFKTSDQILNCKEEIDQNYIDVAVMKLKMIKNSKA